MAVQVLNCVLESTTVRSFHAQARRSDVESLRVARTKSRLYTVLCTFAPIKIEFYPPLGPIKSAPMSLLKTSDGILLMGWIPPTTQPTHRTGRVLSLSPSSSCKIV